MLEMVIETRRKDLGGFEVGRVLPFAQRRMVGPWVFFDHFGPVQMQRGLPRSVDVRPHPHIGLSTVTYLFDGEIMHRDSLGVVQPIKPGALNLMTAGRGIIHSEMPQQVSGAMRGFQLWINLPAKEKMKPAGYQDIQVESIPKVSLAHGGTVKVIAGSFQHGNQTIAGPIHGISTAPVFLDVHLPPNVEFEYPLARELNAFVYTYEGSLEIGSPLKVAPRQAAIVLGDGDQLKVRAGADGAQFIALAALPLHEPIVQYGPFVMNTRAEIEQAIDDYQNNRFVISS